MNSTTSSLFKSQRKTSIELLRVFTMMAVVILHYNNRIDGSGFGRALFFVDKGSLNEVFLYFIQSICIVAVDLFILITGYFSCTSTKKSIQKPIRLIVQVVIFNFTYYFAQVIINKTDLTLKHITGQFLPCNYFVILYSTVFFISPFINFGLQKLSVKSLNILIFISFCLFSLEPTFCDILAKLTGNELHGLYTISGLMDLVMVILSLIFFCYYTIGVYLRFSADEKKINFLKKQWFLSLMILINTCLLFFWQYLLPKPIQTIATDYCNPLVIINAALILLFFNNINVKQNKIVNRIATGSFTVFLTHGWFMRFFDVKSAVTQALPVLFLHILFTASVCYILGFIIHEVYSFIQNQYINSFLVNLVFIV